MSIPTFLRRCINLSIIILLILQLVDGRQRMKLTVRYVKTFGFKYCFSVNYKLWCRLKMPRSCIDMYNFAIFNPRHPTPFSDLVKRYLRCQPHAPKIRGFLQTIACARAFAPKGALPVRADIQMGQTMTKASFSVLILLQ